MIRNLFCHECRERMELHPEDIVHGWKMRRVTIEKAKVPDHHQIEIHAGDQPVHIIPVPMLVCDGCNDEIPVGGKAVAVTMWQASQEDEPGNWEEEFTQA